MSTLFATTVANAKPQDRDYKLSDGGGLYLLVRANGAKLWRLNYRYLEKYRTLAFGAWPEVNNGGNALFETWWDDSFIQSLVVQALGQAGVPDAFIEDGRSVVEAAARAADEVESGSSPREGAWRVLSRLFSINP